jgi:hypothetical protein
MSVDGRGSAFASAMVSFAFALTLAGCRSGHDGDASARAARADHDDRDHAVTEPQALTSLPSAVPTYPWHPRSSERLDARFAPPPGFVRVPLADGSFGAFLRALPLLPAATPVVDYRGSVVRAADDPRVAAVVDIDVGQSDLQQCADAVLRMNAEWRYGRGDRDIAYPIASGAVLSYPKYLAGERALEKGPQMSAAAAADSHRVFRAYLDEVFAWANTASLQHGSAPAPFVDVQPGEFFVMAGRPFGHAVLVLDVARHGDGRVALLLGQSYMPAQSFHVLAGAEGAWFVVTSGAAGVETPFWRLFPLSALRRLP